MLEGHLEISLVVLTRRIYVALSLHVPWLRYLGRLVVDVLAPLEPALIYKDLLSALPFALLRH